MADASFEPLSGSGYEPGGEPALAPITGFAYEPGGSPALAQLTASGFGQNWDAQGAGALEVLTGDAIGVPNYVSTGTAALAALTADAHTPTAGAGSFELLAVAAQSDSGQAASGAPTFLPLASDALGTGVGIATGVASFQSLAAAVLAQNGGAAVGAATLRLLQASASGLGGQVGAAAGSFQQFTVLASGAPQATASGAPSFERIMSYASGEPTLGEGLDTWAMNTRTNAVTKYPSFPANSMARYNSTYLAAGPTGLYVMEGESTLETGTEWKVRTGHLDDKKPGLKRLTELLVAARYDDAIRVRVWKNDSEYYDYTLPNVLPDELQQMRVKTGKGVKSRYFMVELSGSGSRFELDSLQVTMPETARRVG